MDTACKMSAGDLEEDADRQATRLHDEETEPASLSLDIDPASQQVGNVKPSPVVASPATFKSQVRPETSHFSENNEDSTSYSGSACLGVKAQLMRGEDDAVTCDFWNGKQLGASLSVGAEYVAGKVEGSTESIDGPASVPSMPVETVPLRRGSHLNRLPPQRPGAFRIPGVPRIRALRGSANRLESNEAPVAAAPPSESLIIDAVLVTEDTNNPGTPNVMPNIQVATAADPVEFVSRGFRRRAVFLLIVAAVIVVASTVGAVVASNREQLPAMYRNVTITEFRNVLLPASSLEQATLDPLSSPGRALQWLESDVLTSKMLGWRMLQRFSLAVIYFALNGEQWSNRSGWVSPQNECTWFRATEYLLDGDPCDSSGQFAFLGLPDNNVSGSIPPELNLLTKLEVINLRDNIVSGSIPDGIESLTSVHSFILGGNRLNGTVPSELRFMTKLTRIIFEKNILSGTLPSEIGMLHELRTLLVRNNMLNGALPTELGLLGKLQTIDANTNSLTGSIPTEVGGMISLKTFELNRNMLTGTIPTEFAVLPRIELISLHGNDGIRGDIPSQVCLLSCSS
jgi:hypothetical protein